MCADWQPGARQVGRTPCGPLTVMRGLFSAATYDCFSGLSRVSRGGKVLIVEGFFCDSYINKSKHKDNRRESNLVVESEGIRANE